MPGLNYDSDSGHKKQIYKNLIVVSIFLLIVTILGSIMVSQLYKQSRQITGNTLTVLLKVNQETMDLWIEHISSDIQSWASIPHFQSLVEKHLTHSRDRQSLLSSKTLDAGFADYITKPVNIGKFHRVIANTINRKKEQPID